MAPSRRPYGSLPFPAILLGVTLLSAACGGEGEPGDGDPPSDPPIDFPATADSTNVDHGARQAWYESGYVIDAMNAQAPRGVDLPTAPSFPILRWATDLANLPRTVARPELVFGSECIPVITGYDDAGNIIDSDADGIPDDYKVDYGDNCVSEIEGGVVKLTISGSRRLQDTGFGFRSFRVTTNDLTILVDYVDTHVTHRLQLSGYEEGSFKPGAAHYAQVATVREHAFDPKAGIDDDRYRQIIEAGDFVPADGATLALGAPLPAGTLSYHADLGHMDPVDPLLPTRLFYHFIMAATTALAYDPTCHGGDFVTGVVDGKLNGGSETGFRLIWNGCAELPTRELFGYL